MDEKYCACGSKIHQYTNSIFGCPDCDSTIYRVPIENGNGQVIGDTFFFCSQAFSVHQMVVDSWIRRAIYYVDNPVD